MGWKTEYKRAMVRYLLNHGSPVSRGSRTYGWIAEDHEEQRAAVTRALADPAFDYNAVRLEESEWTDFDSFDGGDTHHGVDALVDIDGDTYRLRYSGTFTEILFGVLDESEED